ncbi:hypothetical protein [Ruegeria sp. YS9]|uniref:hypothetical protein n=1 Tax=Ruegeria sp. YS9 TaxID=2966453 RepID=UPI00214B9EE9|nr:hypothetical protein [Ruegeria sp. YS9]UUV07355.1 hypothetical protein NOR97_06255 [Ruegeria sp. YS9]
MKHGRVCPSQIQRVAIAQVRERAPDRRGSANFGPFGVQIDLQVNVGLLLDDHIM